jgi:hypothetical protein
MPRRRRTTTVVTWTSAQNAFATMAQKVHTLRKHEQCEIAAHKILGTSLDD